MYLIVFLDGTSKQTSENLTAMDYVSASQGISKIFRFREVFEWLVFDREKPFWVPVKQSRILSCKEGVLNS